MLALCQERQHGGAWRTFPFGQLHSAVRWFKAAKLVGIASHDDGGDLIVTQSDVSGVVCSQEMQRPHPLQGPGGTTHMVGTTGREVLAR